MAKAGVAVVGAGSWGTTVAALMAAKRTDDAVGPVAASWRPSIGRRPREPRLPARDRPARGLRATASLAEAVEPAPHVVLMAVPSHGFRAVLGEHGPAPGSPQGRPWSAWPRGSSRAPTCGCPRSSAQVLPAHPAGVLTGPNLAREVAEGQPAATVVALADEDLARRVQELLHCGTFRVYTGTDVVGCEIAGATKNVMAIAAGICDGLGFGENTRAALDHPGPGRAGSPGHRPRRPHPHLRRPGRRGRPGGHLHEPPEPEPHGGCRARPGPVARRGPRRHAHGGRGREDGPPLVELAAAHGVEMPIAEQVAAIVAGATRPATPW